MLYFLLRLVIYTLSTVLVVYFVPGLSVLPFWGMSGLPGMALSYLFIGLVFGVLHAFVRPLILFMTGRLYLASMGLLTVGVDTFLFLILSYAAPIQWQIGPLRVFSALLGAAGMGLSVMLLEALTGIGSPHIQDVQKSPFYWRWFGLLPAGRRNIIAESLRTQYLANILWRYAVDILVGLSPFGDFRRSLQGSLFRRRPALIEKSPYVKLRLMLQALGPTFVKFGQLAASRIEILPAELQLELNRLQDQVAPFPEQEVQRIIRQELGKPPAEIFRTFEPKPLAAASIAQIHAAVLVTGEPVVVKIRRPDIQVTVKADLNVIQDTISLLEKRLPFSRRFGLSSLFAEFAENILTELDYRNEAYNANLLRHNMKSFPAIHIPEIYQAYSTSQVLCMERVEGVRITDLAALAETSINREDLGIQFFKALLQQVLFDGFFHADPHPGNVWVNLQSGQVIFLDMGLVGRLSFEDRLLFGNLIWALQDRDAHSVRRIVVTICHTPPNLDVSKLEQDIERLINRNLLFTTSNLSLTELMTELVGLLLHHNLQLRKEFTLVLKSIGQGESIMRTLMGDRPVDAILNIIYEQLRELLVRQFKNQGPFVATGKSMLRETLERLPNLQGAFLSFLDDFQRGELIFQMNNQRVEQRVGTFRQNIDHGFRQIVLSVLLVGLLLGSALLLVIPLDPMINPNEALIIHRVAEAGFMLGAVLVLLGVLSQLWQFLQKIFSGK
jgi:ubiquinone biosynthesis protein